jgi:hypothetical protein
MSGGGVTAAVTNGSLLLTGGDGQDQVKIDQVGLAADQFHITGLNGTTVNGGADLVVSGVLKDIHAIFGDGSNHFQLDNCRVAGDIVYEGGNSLDNVSVIGGRVGGDITMMAAGADRYDTLYLTDLTAEGTVSCSAEDNGNPSISLVNSAVGSLLLKSEPGAVGGYSGQPNQWHCQRRGRWAECPVDRSQDRR